MRITERVVREKDIKDYFTDFQYSIDFDGVLLRDFENMLDMYFKSFCRNPEDEEILNFALANWQDFINFSNLNI